MALVDHDQVEEVPMTPNESVVGLAKVPCRLLTVTSAEGARPGCYKAAAGSGSV